MREETDSIFDSAEFLRRLVKRYQPGHWIGGLRRAFGPVAELVDEGGSNLGDLETHPAHYLVALWRPARPPILSSSVGSRADFRRPARLGSAATS